MKLRIQDYAWGITRDTGTRSERKVEDVTLDILKEGPLPPVGPSRHVFVVEKMEGDRIFLRCSPRRDPIWIGIGEEQRYIPVSFDGGHYYILRLEK